VHQFNIKIMAIDDVSIKSRDVLGTAIQKHVVRHVVRSLNVSVVHLTRQSIAEQLRNSAVGDDTISCCRLTERILIMEMIKVSTYGIDVSKSSATHNRMCIVYAKHSYDLVQRKTQKER